MLQAIFYARFHPDRGPSVILQYPPGESIVAANNKQQQHDQHGRVNFSDISSYIIPPYELCNRPLSICANGLKVLGFPVSLEEEHYERNRFTFNVCFVIADPAGGGDVEEARDGQWEAAVRKTAAFFTALEEDDGILQAEERLKDLKWAGEHDYPASDVGVVYAVLEAVMRDINAHGECCVRVDALHTLNLRLSSSSSSPSIPTQTSKVRGWDVPLLIRPLPSEDDCTWDLVLSRIRPHMDGVKHVRRIAELADVDVRLVKAAVRGLLAHARVLLLDIFHFHAIYALTRDFATFVNDPRMLRECCSYVAVDPASNPLAAPPPPPSTSASPLTAQRVVALYRSLGPGGCVHDFVLAHRSRLADIDVRRLITYGVIRGFLRRIHKYALAVATPPPSALHLSGDATSASGPRSAGKSADDAARRFDRAWRKAALSSGWATPPSEPAVTAIGSWGREKKNVEFSGEVMAAGANEEKEGGEDEEADEKLRRFADGSHCMDRMCVELRASEKEVVAKLKGGGGKFGEVILFNK